MKFLASFSVILLSLSSIAIAGDGFVQLDLKKVTSNNTSFLNNRLEKFFADKGNGQVPLTFQQQFYFTEIEVGSNSQPVSVLVDTGSSDLWVQTTLNSFCNSFNCEQFGVFDESKSTTFFNNGTLFFTSYGNGYHYAEGLWGQDTVTIGNGITVKQANLGFANNSNTEWGLLGISFAGLESTVPPVPSPNDTVYDNFPIQLKQQGFTKKVAYSLYLTNNGTSNILFGGIDTAKYDGKLGSTPEIRQGAIENFINVQLDHYTVTINNNNTGGIIQNSTSHLGTFPPIPVKGGDLVFVDSGTPFLALPNGGPHSIISQIHPGAVYNSTLDNYLVSCSLAHPENYFTFHFKDNNVPINLPLSEVILWDDENAFCYLNIYDGGSGGILGASFLRHAYTVFNLEDKVVSFGQLKITDDTLIITIE